jgi:uncharacterized protein VirK/YbjX
MWEGNGITISIKRMLVLLRALFIFRNLRPFLNAPPSKALGKLVKQRPQILGAVVWSYQCSAWDAKTRLEKIVEHCSVIDEIGYPLDFPVDSYIEFLGLSKTYQDLRVTISQPKSLFRDGLLTMRLFVGTQIIYSLSFSFFRNGDNRAAFIGQIQGSRNDRALEQYRELTKACCGMRPRDLLIEIFCIFCLAIGIRHVFSVAEEYRRLPYRLFLKNTHRVMSTDYNTIWEDRGGVRVNRISYRLDVERRRRSDKTITSKKRRMYLRRYEMLGNIEAQISESLSSPLVCRHIST